MIGENCEGCKLGKEYAVVDGIQCFREICVNDMYLLPRIERFDIEIGKIEKFGGSCSAFYEPMLALLLRILEQEDGNAIWRAFTIS